MNSLNPDLPSHRVAEALREIVDSHSILMFAMKQSNYCDLTPSWWETFDIAKKALAAYDAERKNLVQRILSAPLQS